MAAHRIVYLLFLLGMGAFFIFYSGEISLLFFIIALSLPVFSLLASLFFMRRLSVSVTSAGTLTRGGETKVYAAILSGSQECILPGRIRLTCTDRMSGSTRKIKFVTPDPEGCYFPFQSEHCGVWQIDVTRAEVFDFLGLFAFRVRNASSARITVNPIPHAPEPRPDFTSLRTTASRPKPGGGFSEIHELREYRPGDPLRSIHWKLTAKTDDLIVREAEEPISRRVLVSYTLTSDRDRNDRTLDRLMWVSSELLSMEIPHRIQSADGGQECAVDSRDDFDAFLRWILAEPLPDNASPDSQIIPPADWYYRADGGEEEKHE